MNIKEYRKSLEEYSAYERSGQQLTHWGIKGMEWGKRRWQNEDGSLTEAGRIHYGVGAARKQAKNEARVIKAQAKAKAYEEAQKVKMAIKEAKGKAEAEAIKIKAEKQYLVDQAKQDRKAVEAEAEAETKNRKIAASVEKQAESNRHKEGSTFKKLILGGAAVAGGLLIINALKDKSVADLNVPSGGAGDNDLLRDNYNAAQKMIVDLQGKNAKQATTIGAMTKNLTTQRDTLRKVAKERNLLKDNYGAAQKLLADRNLLKDNYGAAQKLLYEAKNVTLSSIPDMYRNQF